MIRTDRLAIGAAAAFALLTPIALLVPWTGVPATKPGSDAPLDVPPVRELSAAYERPLFATVPEAEASLPPDAPALVGIAGRLGTDAVAIVRGAEGTRTLHIGESIDGWTLASLAIDAAFFTRGAQRVRVPLPAG